MGLIVGCSSDQHRAVYESATDTWSTEDGKKAEDEPATDRSAKSGPARILDDNHCFESAVNAEVFDRNLRPYRGESE